MADLTAVFLNSYRELCRATPTLRQAFPPTVALPAFFDFLVSVAYVQTIRNASWLYCPGNPPDEQPALYLPFLNACPRCSIRHGRLIHLPDGVKTAKPPPARIGAASGDAMLLLLHHILSRTAPTLRIAKSSNNRGDVDALFYNQDIIALAEFKASPLIAYPLEVLVEPLQNQTSDGHLVLETAHSAGNVISGQEISMYIPHRDTRILLGYYNNSPDWLFPALRTYIALPANVEFLVRAWEELYRVYRDRRTAVQRRRDHLRWLMFGDGDVDDSKNAPGLDRTDDVKKGTYQVLKFGASYKDSCLRGVIRAVLASNFSAYHTYDAYLRDVRDVLWTKSQYELELHDPDSYAFPIRAFPESHMFSLFDGVVGLTDGFYRDPTIAAAFDLNRFMDKLCQ